MTIFMEISCNVEVMNLIEFVCAYIYPILPKTPVLGVEAKRPYKNEVVQPPQNIGSLEIVRSITNWNKSCKQSS